MNRTTSIWTGRAAGSLIIAGMLCHALSGAQSQKPETSVQPKFDELVPLQPIERFAGPVSLRSAKAGKGAQAEVHMALRTWMIQNRQRIDHVPESGFLLVQVRSGEDVVTVINGERRERKAEEFFTVPAGAKFSVETGNDSAILQVFSLTTGAAPSSPKK